MERRSERTLHGNRLYVVYHTPAIRRDVESSIRGRVEIDLVDNDRIELTPDEARLMGLRLIEAASAAEEELHS